MVHFAHRLYLLYFNLLYKVFRILVGNQNICKQIYEHIFNHTANGLNNYNIHYINTSNVETLKLNTDLRLVLAHKTYVSLRTVESHKIIAGAMIN